MSSAPHADLDLRLVRAFVAVAEHGALNRAASALAMQQSSLSRQISRLEELVGVRLLVRTPSGSELTPAGEAFLPRARDLLRASDRATARARAAANPELLRVAYTADVAVTAAVDALRRRYAAAEVHTAAVEWNDSHAVLHTGAADVLLARMPFETEGLDVTVLFTEPAALYLAGAHALASRASVRMADFAAEPLLRFGSGLFCDAWAPDPRPDGTRGPLGPAVENWPDAIELIVSGQTLSVGWPSPQTLQYRPDLAMVLIEDWPRTSVALATRTGPRSPLLTPFCQAAAAYVPRPDGDVSPAPRG